jgi:hypothetical protein
LVSNPSRSWRRFGFGLKRNVLDIYKFVCRNYRSHLDYRALGAAVAKTENRAERYGPWQSDDIFGFGFSRRFGANGGLEWRIPERAFERVLPRRPYPLPAHRPTNDKAAK